MQLRFGPFLILLLGTSILFITGCGKSDEATAPVSPPPTPPLVDPSHPTTQQLLTGPRGVLDVKFAPVTLQVPTGWEVKSYNDGALVTIEGQTPTDVVSISVPVNHTITVDQEKSLEAHARQDFAKHPDLLHKAGIRQIEGGTVIEHLQVDAPTTDPASTQPIQTIQWTYTLCIPNPDPKEFTAYELRFLGMTVNQYKADQAFLRSIMDSLTYTPPAPSTGDPVLK